MTLTCIIDGIPHLIAADEARLLNFIVLKNSLQIKSVSLCGMYRMCNVSKYGKIEDPANLPLFDLNPQLSKLL